MIDITLIELNTIPPPIAELKRTNTILNNKNLMLTNIITFSTIVLGIIIISEILVYYKEDDERKNGK